jgi:hypothetical protein
MEWLDPSRPASRIAFHFEQTAWSDLFSAHIHAL